MLNFIFIFIQMEE